MEYWSHTVWTSSAAVVVIVWMVLLLLLRTLCVLYKARPTGSSAIIKIISLAIMAATAAGVAVVEPCRIVVAAFISPFTVMLLLLHLALF